MNRLLIRQIKRICGGIENIPIQVIPLLTSISKSYDHYEEDRLLLNRAMDLSSKELYEANQLLREDAKNNTLILRRLLKSLSILTEDEHMLKIEKEPDLVTISEMINEYAHKTKAFEQQLQEANKYKSDFLANMSHELRTPLNSILLLAKVLQQNKTHNLTEKQIKQLSVIESAGKDLLSLINDILDLAKIESGKFTLDIERFQIGEIVQETSNLFETVAKEKGVFFRINCEESLDFELVSDKKRIVQILRNLLSNAFKFTHAGGQVIFGFKICETCGNNFVSFSVEDSGIGIEQEKIKVIFEAFQQADGSTTRKYGGTGLGLNISKNLTALLKGNMNVESIYGKGSKFTLNIPQYMG